MIIGTPTIIEYVLLVSDNISTQSYSESGRAHTFILQFC